MKNFVLILIIVCLFFTTLPIFSNQSNEELPPLNFYEKQTEGFMSHPLFPAFYQLSNGFSFLKVDFIDFNLTSYGISPLSNNLFFAAEENKETRDHKKNEGQIADFIFTMGIFGASTAGSKAINSREILTIIPIFPIYSNLMHVESEDPDVSQNYGLYFIFSSQF